MSTTQTRANELCPECGTEFEHNATKCACCRFWRSRADSMRSEAKLRQFVQRLASHYPDTTAIGRQAREALR